MTIRKERIPQSMSLADFQMGELPEMRSPLPIVVTRGMRVYETWTGTIAEVVGFTQMYCLYKTAGATEVSVAPWSEVALANICPADAVLPRDMTEIDRANARAALLREFLVARAYGLSAAQETALLELESALCGMRAP